MTELTQGKQATLDELEAQCLQHYEELAAKAHHWSNQVPQAIKFWYAHKRALEQTNAAGQEVPGETTKVHSQTKDSEAAPAAPNPKCWRCGNVMDKDRPFCPASEISAPCMSEGPPVPPRHRPVASDAVAPISEPQVIGTPEHAKVSAEPARSEPGKWLRDTTPDERAWHEDSAHENGNYYNTCLHCLRSFIGHKRRVQCKVCATESPPTQETSTRGRDGNDDPSSALGGDPSNAELDVLVERYTGHMKRSLDYDETGAAACFNDAMTLASAIDAAMKAKP